MQTHRLIPSHLLAMLLAGAILTGCSPAAKKSRLVESADKYFEAGEYEKAKIEYLGVLKADPGNALAVERLGLIWSEQGAPMQAFPFLRRAAETAPDNIDVRTKLAMAYLSMGGVLEARKEALAILEKDPGNTKALTLVSDTTRTADDLAATAQQVEKFPNQNSAAFHLASANILFRKQDLLGAQKSLTQAVEVDPKSHEAHASAARLHLARNEPEKAADEYRIAVELAPVRSAVRVQYAEFLLNRGEADKGRAVLDDMIKRAPDYLPASNALARVAFTTKKYDDATKLIEGILGYDSQNLDALLLQCQIRLATGDAKKGLEGLERLETTFPGLPVIRYNLGRARLLNNDVPGAIAALNQAVAADPSHSDAGLLLAELNLRTGKPLPVIDAMIALQKRRPSLAAARILLAQAYIASNQFDEAVDVLTREIQAAPPRAQLHSLLGVALRQQKKIPESRQEFEKALELAPDDLAVLSQLVDLDLIEKKFPEALARVQAQLKKTPSSAPTQFLEANVYVAQEDWVRAEAALHKALELDPKFSQAYNLLIATYVSAKKIDSAIQQLDTLLAKQPRNTPALMTSGLLQFERKDYDKARAAYEKLLAVTPDFIPALNNLSYLYSERFNELDKAFELAKKARQLPSPNAATTASLADTLGWIHYKRGEYPQALTLLQEVATTLGKEPEVRYHLGMASYMMGLTDDARTELQAAAASPGEFPGKSEIAARLDLLGGGSSPPKERGVDEWKSIVKDQPKDIIAQLRLAEAYEKQGAFPEAAGVYEQLLRLNPALPSATQRLALLFAGPLKNPEKAFELATKARQLAPNDPKVAWTLGRLTFQRGGFEAALGLLQESARQLTTDATVQYDLAWAAYSLGRIAEARQAMQLAIKRGLTPSTSEDATSFLALTAPGTSPNPAAEPEIKAALARDPKFVPALMAQAALQRDRGNSKDPATAYEQVLSQFPNFGPAQRDLAALRAEDPTTLAKAYELAMKARESLPDDPATAEVLAKISYKRNDFPYALQLFQESASKSPLGPDSLFYSAMCQVKAGDTTQGREALNQALAAGLKEPLASEAKRVLEDAQNK